MMFFLVQVDVLPAFVIAFDVSHGCDLFAFSVPSFGSS